MVDEMWHVAGDVSVDVRPHTPTKIHTWAVSCVSTYAPFFLQSQWYTKRLLIGGVYTSTELFMITDSSEGHKDTWAYLDRCECECV